MARDRFLAFSALFLVALVFGSGVFTFFYAQGHSYMTDNPKACMNCHVMSGQYNAWQKSSHHAVATCNDCHTPDGLVPKYFTKALNGWNHSVAFTTGRFVDPIHINSRNLRITENSCRKCHESIVHQIDTNEKGQQMSCVRCHNTVGHLE